jgi:hypothetical protein
MSNSGFFFLIKKLQNHRPFGYELFLYFQNQKNPPFQFLLRLVKGEKPWLRV